MAVIKFILALICSPIAMFLHGSRGGELILNIVLYILGFGVLGAIHAIWKIYL